MIAEKRNLQLAAQTVVELDLYTVNCVSPVISKQGERQKR
jgi:hypothetical protein